MQLRLPLTLLLGLGAICPLATGCDDDGGSCEPGEEIDCTCDNGDEGTRYCLSNARFDQCYCGGFDPGFYPEPDDYTPDEDDDDSAVDPFTPFFDAGRDAGRDASLDASVDAASLPADGVLLAAGKDPLLELFAQGEDVWLVQANGITRLSLLDGGVQARWSAPRPLTGAVFDGQRLVALDGAKFTWLQQTDLTAVSSSNLVEPCNAATLLDGGPLVCSSTVNYQSTLSAIEVADGGRSASLRTNRSGELFAVPGTQRMLQVDTSTTSYLPQVFELVADGGLAVVGDAGYGLSSSVNFMPPLAFDTNPAQNVVTRQGILMRINDSCGSSADPCLTRTGTLGALSGQEAFMGLSSAGGELFGLVDPMNSALTSYENRCVTQSCKLLRIDVAGREIRAQVGLRRALRSILGMHAIPAHKALVVALTPGAERYTSVSMDAGYEVVRFELP